MAFGRPAKLYGGIVGAENDDGVLLGFDDGEVRRYTKEALVERHEAKVLMAADPAKGGIISSEFGHGMAAKFLTLKDSGKTVGLFVGVHDIKLAGELPIYQSITIRPGAFGEARTSSRTGGQTAQDRYGLWSFERANMVEYLKAEDGESYSAAVFGVIHHEPEGSQARKMLMRIRPRRLGYVHADNFFLGNWPAWRRMPKDGVVDFNRENPEHVRSLTIEQCEKMLASFVGCRLIMNTDTLRKAIRYADKPPPSLKLLRDLAKVP